MYDSLLQNVLPPGIIQICVCMCVCFQITLVIDPLVLKFYKLTTGMSETKVLNSHSFTLWLIVKIKNPVNDYIFSFFVKCVLFS
jgi:hypothetical protein